MQVQVVCHNFRKLLRQPKKSKQVEDRKCWKREGCASLSQLGDFLSYLIFIFCQRNNVKGFAFSCDHHSIFLSLFSYKK